MKLYRVWILAIDLVCLLWTFTAEASKNPASSFAKHLVPYTGESRSPSFCPSLRAVSGGWTPTRAGPQTFHVFRMCYSVSRAWILRDHPGLNLAAPRLKIGPLGDPRGGRARTSRRRPRRGVKYASAANFSGRAARTKTWVFHQALASLASAGSAGPPGPPEDDAAMHTCELGRLFNQASEAGFSSRSLAQVFPKSEMTWERQAI